MPMHNTKKMFLEILSSLARRQNHYLTPLGFLYFFFNTLKIPFISSALQATQTVFHVKYIHFALNKEECHQGNNQPHSGGNTWADSYSINKQDGLGNAHNRTEWSTPNLNNVDRNEQMHISHCISFISLLKSKRTGESKKKQKQIVI